MNDLDLLRECAPEAPLLSSAELSGARHRVLTTIARGRAASTSGVRPPRAELRPGLARRSTMRGRAYRHGAVHAGADLLPGYADDGGGDGAVPEADPGSPAE